jgi:23S rRNA (adenine2503-C2)-methyltransferase
MRVTASTGHPDHAIVYVLETPNGHHVECVESVQPPIPRDQKWVLLVSTLYGCPIGCPMCDAGGFYYGKPGVDEIFSQIDFLVKNRYPDCFIPCKQFKIQFARMGEPALNPAVLNVLDKLPERYHSPGLIPSISTIAPGSAEFFLERLLHLKNKHYRDGRFQCQFSIHTTDPKLRRFLIPADTLSFSAIAGFGDRYYQSGDRKITLNFIAAANIPIDASVLLKYFSPDRFLVKITPLNPTYRALENMLQSRIEPVSGHSYSDSQIEALRAAGYEVIVSIGNTEENLIGSNCGQYILSHIGADTLLKQAYSYPLRERLS